ncbi:MAG: SDR family oxidoreductase [Nitrospirae bacterium]|jgi:3-oxoacyl-[acyl-carrier protein] reductase|nr:SDR family oxidoreductase [Nitrospirota bacterium]
MKDRTALVTGSTSGIGLAIADELAREGYRVVLTGRRKERLEKIVEDFSERGRTATGIVADLAKPGEAERMFTEALVWSGGRLDVLVNNAGTWQQSLVEDITREAFRSLMSLNLEAPFILSGLAMKIMKEQKGGTIVNISSVAGLEAWARTALYSASKFGLRALTQSLLAEGASFGIKAFAVCPGYVATPMTDGAQVSPDEMIQPHDVARIVATHLSLSPATVLKDVVISRLGAED